MKIIANTVVLVTLLSTVILHGPAAHAQTMAAVLLERLRADHSAMVSAEQDFRMRRERGDLSGNEAADYAGYVAGLHRRVAEDCVALEEQGIAIPPGLSCPDDPAVVIVPAAIDQASEQTGQEVTATLDAELLSGLGDFDEMLLREQERIKAAAPRSSASAGRGAGGGGAGSSSEGAGSSSASASAQGDQASEGSYSPGAGPGSPHSPGKSSAPPGTPDGSDDDVVARQLREAAEKETDPELKKKLWEEYRKYKEGIQ
jgi:hypothetical protein